MTELGETLKQARIKKGLTIDDIHQETKIQSRYLEAIEAGNLDALPGHFYARAFVKSYAEVVGIDPDTILEHIQPEIGPLVEEQVKSLRRHRPAKPPVQAGRWLSRVLLYLFAVLILFVIYIAWAKLDEVPDVNSEIGQPTDTANPPIVDNHMSTPNQPNQSGQGNGIPPNQPPKEEQQPKPTLNFISQKGNLYQYEMTGVSSLTVKISANSACWFSVLKGGGNGEQIDSFTMSKGNSKEWNLAEAKEVTIRLGSAPDVEILVNGQPLDTSKMPRALQIISVVLK
ncbi:helix-turn-helix domain-containing protein [Ammoniphilus resinae]|uniref:Cytoskeletal protein RodZ n=1 Tax=Ammoniphilus resinae TaxID=861532 RepID=A0ABS4GMQ8_9BACL|nr:cytoskeletal protein RodZ [Ammoniphilus resinae]